MVYLHFPASNGIFLGYAMVFSSNLSISFDSPEEQLLVVQYTLPFRTTALPFCLRAHGARGSLVHFEDIDPQRPLDPLDVRR